MNCPTCNTPVPEGSRFCPHCGSLVSGGVKTCPQCGAVAADHAAICPQCGAVFGAMMPAPPPAAGDSGKNGLAVAGLVLGIVGLCCCGGFVSILALIFGCCGLKSQRRGMAIAAIVLGAIGMAFLIVSILVYAISTAADSSVIVNSYYW